MEWLKRREFRSSCPEDSTLWSLRSLMPKRSPWRVAQVDPLRLRLIKIAARVVELKTMIRLHLPTACPNQAIIQLVIERIIVGNARLEIRHLSPLRPPPQPGNNGPGPPIRRLRSDGVNVPPLDGSFGQTLADGGAQAGMVVGHPPFDPVQAAGSESEQKLLPA